jgi:hypothetical protein
VLTDFESGTDVILVDDLRFINEKQGLQDLQTHGIVVYLVHLDVEERTQALRGAAMDRMDHPSETELDHVSAWDLWIPEDSTVAQRAQWIEHLIATGKNST